MTAANDSKYVWTAKAEARFRTKFIVAENGCWEWQAAITSKGYGAFSLFDKSLIAHRTAYIWWVGPVPKGIVIDHLCRNRRCVNPEHLEAVTHKQNLNRGIHRNAVKTVCKYGHPLDGRNGSRSRRCLTCHRIDQNERYHRNKRKVA